MLSYYIIFDSSPRSEVLLESGNKYSFNEDGSEITIMDVKKLDEGDYTCIARNKAGTSEEEVSLRVFGNYLASLGNFYHPLNFLCIFLAISKVMFW